MNCVSIHTTGNEDNATEIRRNVNVHIVENWDKVYKNSYEFPYTEEIGNTKITFQNEDEFIDFLLHEQEATASLWMTHIDMQAVSTMLNMKISILTTGIATPNTFRCGRCKPGNTFNSDNEFRIHMEKVHKRIETNNEKKFRLQKARGSELKPDSRIKETISNEKEAELIMLHEDDIHYNLIIGETQSWLAKKPENEPLKNSHHENTSLFGDILLTAGQPNPRSWAEMAGTRRAPPQEQQHGQDQGASRETLTQTWRETGQGQGVCKETLQQTGQGQEEGWQVMGRKGRKINPVKNETFKIPTQNRFINLGETLNKKTVSRESNKHFCTICSLHFRDETLLDIHMKTTHEIKCPECDLCLKTEKEAEDHKQSAHGGNKRKIYAGDKNISEIDKEKKMHLNTKKSLDTLNVEYNSCKKELSAVQEEKERLKIKVKDLEELVRLKTLDDNDEDMEEIIQPKNVINPNIVNYNCPECDYPCNTMVEKNYHVEKHKTNTVTLEVQQPCTLCKNETNSQSDLKSHIQLKHALEFNCQECDFQESSQIILSNT